MKVWSCIHDKKILRIGFGEEEEPSVWRIIRSREEGKFVLNDAELYNRDKIVTEAEVMSLVPEASGHERMQLTKNLRELIFSEHTEAPSVWNMLKWQGIDPDTNPPSWWNN